MSTNSSVSVRVGDSIKVIYGHWDGYPSHVGRLLLDHYNTQEKAESLVNLGNFSSLDVSVECPEGHSFDSKAERCTTFYGRDRGEEGQECRVYPISEGVPDRELQEFDYYWDGEKWYVHCGYLDELKGGVPLTKEICDNDG